MTSKASWIAFVPLTLAAVAVGFYNAVTAEDSILFGLSRLTLSYITLGCVVALFLIALLLCLFDRKIGRYYIPGRNIPAGILAMLTALVLAGHGASGAFNLFGGSVEALAVAETVLTVFSAIVFIVVGLSHFAANFDSRRFALFYLFPAILMAVRMVRVFVGFTTTSIVFSDVNEMFCYVFATLFFFNYAVMLAATKAKNAVKPCLIYGFPTVAMLLCYALPKLYTTYFTGADVFNFEYGNVEMALLAVYVCCFLIELTKRVRSKDELVIDEPEDEADGKAKEKKDAEETKAVSRSLSGEHDDKMIMASDPDIGDKNPSSYLTTADTSDYIYHATSQAEELRRETAYRDAKSSVESTGYILEKTPEENDSDESADPYASRLDEIDKLILEISEDEFK